MVLITWGEDEMVAAEDMAEAKQFLAENKEYLSGLSSAKVFEVGKQIVLD